MHAAADIFLAPRFDFASGVRFDFAPPVRLGATPVEIAIAPASLRIITPREPPRRIRRPLRSPFRDRFKPPDPLIPNLWEKFIQ